MDRKVRLVAVDSQRYGSRQLRPGDSFEATEGDAADAVALGLAKPDAEFQSEPAVVKPPAAKKRKYIKTGKYKRRDMRAQDA